MKKMVVALITGVTLTGCLAVPKADQTKADQIKMLTAPSAGKSGIYIFAGNIARDLWLDGDCLGSAGKQGFFYEEVQPGEHIISTESELSPNHLTINTQANQFYYIQQITRPTLMTYSSNLKQLNDDKGQQALKESTLTEVGTCHRSVIKPPR